MFWRVLMACWRVASALPGLSEQFCTLAIAAWTAGRTDALWARSVPMAAMAAAPGGWLADAELDRRPSWPRPSWPQPSWPRLT